MATFFKFNSFVEHVAEKVHNLGADTFKVMLTNTTVSASHTVKADLTDLSTANGYTAGGNTAAVSSSAQTSGVYKLVLTSPTTWTASGAIGPFRYAVLYNDTPTSPADPLIGAWDYGSALTLASGETFAVSFDGTNGVLTIT